ncbi:MAG: sugar transferase [Acidobacteria bacterium]|nr:sugar transferase [Acidobacteriota bacterium]
MQRAHQQFASVVLKLALPLALGIAYLAAIYIRFYSGLITAEDRPAWPAYLAYFVLSAALWSALETRFGIIYRCFEDATLGRWLWSLAELNVLTLALVSSAAFFWRGYSFSRYTVALFWTLHFALCALAALSVRAWLRRRASVLLIVIGEHLDIQSLRRECLPAGGEAERRWFPDVRSFLAALEEIPVEHSEIVVGVSAGGEQPLALLSGALERLPVPASIALHGLAAGEVRATRSFLLLSSSPAAAETFDYVFSKRLIDVAVSLAGLIVLAPLLAAIAAIIRLRSGRPVLLAQQRVGRGGRPFSLYKFRTLPVESLADADRRWNPPPTDHWGRFLRSTGFDELPQLFNVLRGEMSLVGPRPERPHFVDQFRRQLPFYATRHRFRVGITGWAQVHGWRGDTSIPRRVEYDLYYLRHWSLALDFRILWMTLMGLFRHARSF